MADVFTLKNTHLIEVLKNNIQIFKHVYNIFISEWIPSPLFLIFSSERRNQCFHRHPRFEKKRFWGNSSASSQVLGNYIGTSFIGKTPKCGEANCSIVIFNDCKIYRVIYSL